MINIPWLDPEHIELPDTANALKEPNGLLAAGGGLTPEWLLTAYERGIFPWFSDDDPILWWSPSPRTILYLDQLHISRSLGKALRKADINISFDTAFSDVVDACAQPRSNEDDPGTWITNEIRDAYVHLHELGFAHSVEVWRDGELIGGLYGIALGKMFFGESMFSFQANGSKFAMFYLVEQLKQWQFIAIDCQVHNKHLQSMGAIQIAREEFEGLLKRHVSGKRPIKSTKWQL